MLGRGKGRGIGREGVRERGRRKEAYPDTRNAVVRKLGFAVAGEGCAVRGVEGGDRGFDFEGVEGLCMGSWMLAVIGMMVVAMMIISGRGSGVLVVIWSLVCFVGQLTLGQLRSSVDGADGRDWLMGDVGYELLYRKKIFTLYLSDSVNMRLITKL